MQKMPKRTYWGSIGDFALFGCCIGIIGLAAAMQWRTLDMAIAFAILGFYVVGSVLLLLRLWKHRAEPSQIRLGQLAVLPPAWRRWVMGERGDPDDK